MDLKDLDYDLPESLIAQTPAENRDGSRLLVLNRETGTINHRIFADIVDYLQPGDLLIANESRVLPARLFGFKQDSGGKVEILLLHKISEHRWKALVGGARTRLQTVIRLYAGKLNPSTPSALTCRVIECGQKGERVLEFSEPIENYLDHLGTMPLPPYIHQNLEDQERYQTVYAKTLGSAAAPTAGLHFTPDLLLKLRQRNINLGFVTLHIGLDTFRPISETVIEDHLIHQEWCSLECVGGRANQSHETGGRESHRSRNHKCARIGNSGPAWHASNT